MNAIDVTLGEGTAVLTITVRGSECAVADAMMILVHRAKRLKRRRIDAGKKALKPCGCKDKK